MSSEILEFTIFPDGRVVETVKGIKGESCTQLTEDIEAKLGTVTHRSDTDERFETSVEQKDKQSQTQRTWDTWEQS